MTGTIKLHPAYAWTCSTCGKDRVAKPVDANPPATVDCDWCGAEYEVEQDAKPTPEAKPEPTPEPAPAPAPAPEVKPSE